MTRVALSCCGVLAVAASVAGGQAPPAPPALDALTAPAASLPAGCVLAPAPSEKVGSRRVVGFWFYVPVPTNPWTGDTPRVLAEVRPRMFDPVRMPDALPDARLAAQLERDLVAGLAGYAAFYRQGDQRVSVYALRGAELPLWPRPSSPDSGGSWAVARIRSRDLAVMAAGDAGPCFDAVERHLRAAVATTDRPAAESRP